MIEHKLFDAQSRARGAHRSSGLRHPGPLEPAALL